MAQAQPQPQYPKPKIPSAIEELIGAYPEAIISWEKDIQRGGLKVSLYIPSTWLQKKEVSAKWLDQ